MVTIKLSAKGTRTTQIVEDDVTLRKIIEDAGVNPQMTPPMINGEPVDSANWDSSLGSLGFANRNILLTFNTKTGNASK